jgi:hypothetical protein
MFELNAKIEQTITNLPELKKQHYSILEIAGFPHYENVISNLLAFYFDFEEMHGLQDLFIKSLFSSLNLSKEYTRSENINVYKEVSTHKNKRIDLVIELDEYAIAIENKVFHTLKNPLNEYENYLKSTYPDKKHIGIILSIHPVKLKARSFFKSILYHKYCQSLSRQLGTYITVSNNFHASFVTDFITTLNNLKKDSIMNNEVIEYMSNHYDEFVKVQEIFTTYFKEVHQKINTVEKTLNLKKHTKSKRRWKAKDKLHNLIIYDLKDCYEIKNLHLKVRITPKGWTIELWGTNLLPDRKKIFLSKVDGFKVNEHNVEYAIIEKAKYQTHPSEFKELVESTIKELYKMELD